MLASNPGDIRTSPARREQTCSIALADSAITRRIAELGDTPLPLSPAEFTKLVAAEFDKWAALMRVAGVRTA